MSVKSTLAQRPVSSACLGRDPGDEVLDLIRDRVEVPESKCMVATGKFP